LSAAKGDGAARADESLGSTSSFRTASLQGIEPSQRAAHARAAEPHAEHDGKRTLLRQIAVDESLQFHLDAVDVGENAAPQPAVAPVVALVGRSPLVRGVVRTLSAVLLLLAFTLCLNAPAARPIPSAPRRSGEPWRIRHLQRWLRTRYLSRGLAGRG
jgi:hypothetical protein